MPTDDSARQRLISLLAASCDDADRRMASRIAECSRHPCLRHTASGRVYLSRDRCRCRHCPACSRLRAARAADRILHALRQADDLRLLTLTLASQDAPLAEQLDHLTASWRRLRQQRSWRVHCRGAIGTIQLTWSAERMQWHPHLHVIIDGDYWPQPQIVDAWKRASGGSTIIDIRPVRSRSAHARYIARYVVSPDGLGEWPGDVVMEYVHAMRSRRAIISCGTMHGCGLPTRDTDDEPSPSAHLLSLRVLARGLRAGNGDAAAVRTWLVAHDPVAAACLPVPPGPARAIHPDAAGWTTDRVVATCTRLTVHDGIPPPTPPPPPPLLTDPSLYDGCPAPDPGWPD